MNTIALIATLLWFLGAIVLASTIRWFGKLLKKIDKGNYSLAMKHIRKLEKRLREQANNGDLGSQSLLDDIAHMYDELADELERTKNSFKGDSK